MEEILAILAGDRAGKLGDSCGKPVHRSWEPPPEPEFVLKGGYGPEGATVQSVRL